jgi:MtN3 and saliva related transmembrane protein
MTDAPVEVITSCSGTVAGRGPRRSGLLHRRWSAASPPAVAQEQGLGRLLQIRTLAGHCHHAAGAALIMISGAQFIGTVAAVCTTVSYVPQLYKCWTRKTAADLSLYMLLVLATGLALWIIYGVMQGDAVIVTANSAGLTLLGMIISFNIREMISARRRGRSGGKADA